MAGLLLDLVHPRLGADGRAWLQASVAGLGAPLDREGFPTMFTAAARRVGWAVPAPSAEALARLRAGGVTWSAESWELDDLTRAALLLRTAAAMSLGAFETSIPRRRGPAALDDSRAPG